MKNKNRITKHHYILAFFAAPMFFVKGNFEINLIFFLLTAPSPVIRYMPMLPPLTGLPIQLSPCCCL